MLAAVAGTLHGLVSVYWGLGGRWLLDTLGERIVTAFAGLEWVLLPVGAVKLAGALVPLWLDRHDWPAGRLWRPLCWLGAGGLVLWGGLNAVGALLTLSGVVTVDDPDRAGLIGHAFLWDPLFALWGVALAIGLWRTRSAREVSGVATTDGAAA